MASKETILLLLLVQTPAVIFSEDNLIFSRSSHFKPWENKQLMGYVVKRFDSPSLLSCGQKCLRNAWCTSKNFKLTNKEASAVLCSVVKHAGSG